MENFKMYAHYTVMKNFVILIALNLFLFGCLFAQGKFQGSSTIIPDSLLQTSKQTLTDSQKKLGTDLLQLTDSKYLPAGSTLQSLTGSMKILNQFKSLGTDSSNALTIGDAEVYVYIYLNSDVLTQVLDSLVTKITDRDESNHIAVAWIKVKNLQNITSLTGVKQVQSVLPPIKNTGSVTTEGDAIMRTANVRSAYSQSGAGVNVGIISDGVDHRSSSQATGDLPADNAGLTILSNTVGGDEGTAMLEIVHEMVPSSGLYFHDHGTNTIAFNNAIDALMTAGCKIVCDDISWITEPFFEEGTVASHVDTLLKHNNMIYVSSAGNAGQSHYQGDYYPIPSKTQHDFSRGGSGSDYYLYINMPVSGTVTIVLEWNDKFGSSANNYNLYLYSYKLKGVVANSLNTQNGTQNPLEVLSYTANSSSSGDFAIIVDKASGVTKTLEVYIYPGNGTGVYSNNITPVQSTFGHPAVVGAIGVGAVSASTPTTIEGFSSQGPLYNYLSDTKCKTETRFSWHRWCVYYRCRRL